MDDIWFTPVERALAATMHCFEPTDNDLAIKLGALQPGGEVCARVAALPARPDSRVAYHGTSFQGLVGIMNEGFRGSPSDRGLQTMVYVSPETVVGWRYPINLETGEYIAEGLPKLKILVACHVPPSAMYNPSRRRGHRQLGFMECDVHPFEVIFTAMSFPPRHRRRIATAPAVSTTAANRAASAGAAPRSSFGLHIRQSRASSTPPPRLPRVLEDPIYDWCVELLIYQDMRKKAAGHVPPWEVNSADL